jgi:hypothetical protein
MMTLKLRKWTASLSAALWRDIWPKSRECGTVLAAAQHQNSQLFVFHDGPESLSSGASP